MKFEILNNIFNSEVKTVDLSENEIAYIAMLASGVRKKKIIEILHFSNNQILKLYDKLGLTDKTKKRDNQAVTLMMMNNLIKSELFADLYNKYDLIECKEMAEFCGSY